MSPKTLVLTVGTNPTPCAVAFEALGLGHFRPDRVSLLGGNTLAASVDALAGHIRRRMPDVEVSRSLVDAWDAAKVRDAMAGIIEEAGAADVHVNYTGGTKIMASQAVAVAAKLEVSAQHRSYLDPVLYDLRLDNGQRYGIGPQEDLRDCVRFSLDELLALHSLRLTNATYESQFPETVKYLLGVYGEGAHSAAELREARSELDDELRKRVTTWPADGPYRNIGAAACADLRARGLPCDAVVERRIEWRTREAQAMRDRLRHQLNTGKWLEYAILDRLLRIPRTVRADARPEETHEARFLVAAAIKAKVIDAVPDLELDVVVLRGYQLTVVSATTDHERVKEKAFEALHRAQQLGGEEARAIAVAPVTDARARDVENDLYRYSGTRRHLRVFPVSSLVHDGELQGLLDDWQQR